MALINMSTKNNATTVQAREDGVKGHTTVTIAEAVAYSKILPHTAEAGDPYYIGDAYDKIPLQVSHEWETDMCVRLVISVLHDLNRPLYRWGGRSLYSISSLFAV
jgi:hypothetical protein